MRQMLTSLAVILATMLLIDFAFSEVVLGEFRLQRDFGSILFIAFITATLPRLMRERRTGR